jgi:hypothetical protein
MLRYALPKQDREARLTQFFADAAQAHTARQLGDPTGFHMAFRFFGAPVCRQAFIALTGIHADTLQKARAIAIGSALPSLPAISMNKEGLDIGT